MLLNYDRLMIISLLIFLLISNAVTLRQDKSILFSRVVIQTLIFASVIAFNNLYLKPLENGIGIYGGLFNVSTLSHTFNIFIFIMSSVILLPCGFYVRNAYAQSYSFVCNLLLSAFLFIKNNTSNISTFIIVTVAALSVKIPLVYIRTIVIPYHASSSDIILYLSLTVLIGFIYITLISMIKHSKLPPLQKYLFVLIWSSFLIILFTNIPEEWFNISSISPFVISSTKIVGKFIFDLMGLELSEKFPVKFVLPINFTMDGGDMGSGYTQQTGGSSEQSGSNYLDVDNDRLFLQLREKLVSSRSYLQDNLRRLRIDYDVYFNSTLESQVSAAANTLINRHITAEYHRVRVIEAMNEIQRRLPSNTWEQIMPRVPFADLCAISQEDREKMEFGKKLMSDYNAIFNTNYTYR